MRERLSVAIIFIVFIWACQPNEHPRKEPKNPIGTLPAEDLFWQRNYPEKTFDHKAYFHAMDQAVNIAQSRSVQGTWVDQGPGNLGGRINAMAIQKDNEDIMYLGYSRGGVYKTTDGGQNWASIFNEFTYLSISHIEIDPVNPNTIYIGTGDENISGYPEIGNGVYKSVDGGATWQHMGLSSPSIIGRIHIAPTNTDIIYASAMGIPFEKTIDRGVYKSYDAGANWEQIFFLNDSTGVIDLEVDPLNPDIAYCAGWNRLRSNYKSTISGPDARIWKTTDGGTTWTMLTDGLPDGNLTRIGLDMMGSNSDILVASVSASREVEGCSGSGNQLIGIYITTNGGASWAPVPTDEEINGMPCNAQGGFAWYFGKIRINPNDQNDISLLGVKPYRTLDGGENWFMEDPLFQVHSDCHDLIYYENSRYIATDGGAYNQNPEGLWDDIENISTNQFYRVAYNPHNAEQYYGGLQDNGSTGGSAEAKNNWERIFGGDGFQMAFHPDDDEIFFVESQNGNIVKNKNGSFTGFSQGLNGSKNWDMPYFISPTEKDILYTGTNQIYRRNQESDDEWYPFSEDITDQEDDSPYYQHNISTICQSELNSDYLYAGTSDGLVWRRETSGDWTNITEGLIRRYVTDVKPSPTDENTVYVTLSGYKNNDNTPLVYRSYDRGSNWESIMGDLPQIAVNDIYIFSDLDENNTDETLFIANDAGVYVSKNSGINWERLGDNMPYIPVYDLEYNPIYNQLIAGTFGRGLQTFDLSQVGIGVESNTSEPTAAAFDIKIYPTATNGLITIDHNDSDISLNIYNNNGQLLRSTPAIESIIDISDFANGLYLMEFILKDQRVVHRVIKH